MRWVPDDVSVCTSGPTCSASSVSAVIPNVGFLLHSVHTQEVEEVDSSGVKTGFCSGWECWCQAELNLEEPSRIGGEVYFRFSTSENKTPISGYESRVKSLRKQRVNPRGSADTWPALIFLTVSWECYFSDKGETFEKLSLGSKFFTVRLFPRELGNQNTFRLHGQNWACLLFTVFRCCITSSRHQEYCTDHHII